jgi:hypothetical protein
VLSAKGVTADEGFGVVDDFWVLILQSSVTLSEWDAAGAVAAGGRWGAGRRIAAITLSSRSASGGGMGWWTE